MGDFSWSWIFKGFIHVQIEEGKFVVVCPRPPQNVALGGFTSWSCSGRQRNVLESVVHVQNSCFAYKTNCFLTLLLLMSSSLLKVPILHRGRHVVSTECTQDREQYRRNVPGVPRYHTVWTFHRSKPVSVIQNWETDALQFYSMVLILC